MAVAGGYDEDFVDLTSDHLKCCICCLVLKDPVQIMRCGHRYCALCFEQIKTYSQHLKSPLICPIDREEINLAQVFDDTGMARMICDLKVRCSYHQEGCPWVGELRCLDAHKTSCQHVKQTTAVGPGSETLMKDMCNRMDKYEEALYEKEKEISHMKLLLQQTKDRVDTRDGEISHLKEKSMEMEREIVLLKETNKTLQDNVSSLLLKCENYYLTSKTELMRLDQVVTDTAIQCSDGEKINSLTDGMEKLNRELTEIKFKSDSADETSSRKALETDLLNIHKKLQKLEIDGKDIQGGLNALKCTASTVVESMSSIKDQLQKVEETIKETTGVDEVLQELDIVRGQQLCVDSLFRINKPPLRSTRFTWRIDGFKERFEAKKQFVSPKFYCLPHGHLCQLYSVSSNAQDMALCLRICRGRNAPTTDFRVSILFELVYNDGTKNPYTITLERVESLSNDNFTIKDGEEYSLGRGFADFFHADEFDKYVKNDTCVVICTLTPSN